MLYTLAAATVAQPCLAQLAEIKALTAACKLETEKSCTVYTDSAHAYGVCRVFGTIWVQRGFQIDDGSVITHGPRSLTYYTVIMLPLELAIVKCKAHKTDGSMVTRGNAAADEVAKKAAVGELCVEVMMLTSHRKENIPASHPIAQLFVPTGG